MDGILKLVEGEKKYIVSLRRYFHENPELSLHEKNTSLRIRQELDNMKVPYVVVGDYGIVATIEGQDKKNIVALRADMDALPINEENDLPYKSKNKNVMHACGHDSHMAMLLGACKILNNLKNELKGSVKICFQQAEEAGKCHDYILKELAKFNVKSVFAIHIWSEIQAGKVCIEPGAMMAGCSVFKIKLKGKGAHGAIPHKGISPIIAACSIAQNINSARTYEIDSEEPLVISIGNIESGKAFNVIPEEAIIQGTIRVFSEKMRKYVLSMIKRVSQNTAKAFKNGFEFEVPAETSIVINDKKCTDIARESIKKLLGEHALDPFHRLYVAENFGEYLYKYPGVLALVGAKNSSKSCNYIHHHPKFNIDEDAMTIGSSLYVKYAIDFLKSLK